MRALKFWLSLLLCLEALSRQAFALSGNTVATDNVKARLVSEVASVGPGQACLVALELDIRDGWHTYWRNPGDSGEADQAGLASAARIHRRRYRVDHAASLR